MLSSWKEIAAYLDRGIRTVQRWEHDLELPVHRIGTGKRSPVFATVSELRFWLATTEAARKVKPQPRPVPVQAGRKPIEDSRRLLSSVHSLAHTIAETSVRQRKQAEELQARILQMRARMNGSNSR
jgi:hypothetical protein